MQALTSEADKAFYIVANIGGHFLQKMFVLVATDTKRMLDSFYRGMQKIKAQGPSRSRQGRETSRNTSATIQPIHAKTAEIVIVFVWQRAPSFHALPGYRAVERDYFVDVIVSIFGLELTFQECYKAFNGQISHLLAMT